MSTRPISHSEVSALLTCQHRWDFRYGFQLAGTSLNPKAVSPTLSDGRAWGAGVAAYHAGAMLAEATDTMLATLATDADRLRQFGVFSQEAFDESELLLVGLLDHYTGEHDRLGIERLEHEIVAPIPSRSGQRDSNRYRLQVFFDGVHVDGRGDVWLVEFKLRKQLSSLQMIALSRQLRWYAWAYRKEFGVEPAGIILDERLKALPKPVKLNKDGSPSKVQSCTVDAYRAAGGSDPDVIAKLEAKRWGQQERIFLTTAEIDEAGQQLVSSGQQIRDFDVADRYPVRNPSPMFCGGCEFKDICANPRDVELVDALFERVEPKKDRPPVETPTREGVVA